MIVALLTIEDKNMGYLRYSISKIVAFMVVIFYIIIYIYLSIFMLNNIFGIIVCIIPIAIVALFYYGLIRVIGFIIRKFL